MWISFQSQQNCVKIIKSLIHFIFKPLIKREFSSYSTHKAINKNVAI